MCESKNMKTPEELAALFFREPIGKHVNLDVLVPVVTQIQKDAFESGRMAALNECFEKCKANLTKREFLAFLCESTPPAPHE